MRDRGQGETEGVCVCGRGSARGRARGGGAVGVVRGWHRLPSLCACVRARARACLRVSLCPPSLSLPPQILGNYPTLSLSAPLSPAPQEMHRRADPFGGAGRTGSEPLLIAMAEPSFKHQLWRMIR